MFALIMQLTSNNCLFTTKALTDTYYMATYNRLLGTGTYVPVIKYNNMFVARTFRT